MQRKRHPSLEARRSARIGTCCLLCLLCVFFYRVLPRFTPILFSYTQVEVLVVRHTLITPSSGVRRWRRDSQADY